MPDGPGSLGVADRAEQHRHRVLEQDAQHVFLAAKGLVEGATRDRGLFQDRLDRGRAVAEPAEHGGGRTQNADAHRFLGALRAGCSTLTRHASWPRPKPSARPSRYTSSSTRCLASAALGIKPRTYRQYAACTSFSAAHFLSVHMNDDALGGAAAALALGPCAPGTCRRTSSSGCRRTGRRRSSGR